MAQAKKEGKKGIDRWTNNGYGMTVGKSPVTKAQAQAIEKAMDAKNRKAK